MREFAEIQSNKKIQITHTAEDGGACQVWMLGENKPLTVVYSNGEGWDHVSVSLPNRCPRWDEMCYVKKLFFLPDECVIQYHPEESNYKNFHPHCLHMWRPQGQEIAKPPIRLV